MMSVPLDPTNLHRTAKYFMDNGRVESPEAAVKLLHQFGLTIRVGKEILSSPAHQTALLTLVNVASRTFLGGVEVIQLPNVESKSGLAPNRSLRDAVYELGGKLAPKPTSNWPCAVIGTNEKADRSNPSWRLTWEGWRAGVVPMQENHRLSEDDGLGIGPALAAAVCAAEVFAFHARDHDMAGRRSSGLSLWCPGADWQRHDPREPKLAFLPSRLWIIGLGNLGQSFAWLLGCLPYSKNSPREIVLQDYDQITIANESTSLLTSRRDVDRHKTRVVANWLESRGFSTVIEERRFGSWIQRIPDEPGAALCGVDNALARATLEDAGFGLIVEAGLGAGPQGFRNIHMHTFPASRKAAEIWSRNIEPQLNVEQMPAYQLLWRNGMDTCGVTQLASRTVAVPFVSLTAGCLAISELLRRLHGSSGIELASLSMLAMDDVEAVPIETCPYSFGYVPVANQCVEVDAIKLRSQEKIRGFEVGEDFRETSLAQMPGD